MLEEGRNKKVLEITKEKEEFLGSKGKNGLYYRESLWGKCIRNINVQGRGEKKETRANKVGEEFCCFKSIFYRRERKKYIKDLEIILQIFYRTGQSI